MNFSFTDADAVALPGEDSIILSRRYCLCSVLVFDWKCSEALFNSLIEKLCKHFSVQHSFSKAASLWLDCSAERNTILSIEHEVLSVLLITSVDNVPVVLRKRMLSPSFEYSPRLSEALGSQQIVWLLVDESSPTKRSTESSVAMLISVESAVESIKIRNPHSALSLACLHRVAGCGHCPFLEVPHLLAFPHT